MFETTPFQKKNKQLRGPQPVQELSFVKYTTNAFDAKILNSLECQFSAKECNMKLRAPKTLQSMMKKTYT